MNGYTFLLPLYASMTLTRPALPFT